MLLLLYPFMLLAIVLTVKGECTGGCNQPVAIYKDLQCKPIYGKPSDCCPMKFDCSNIEKRPADKCTYRGRSYAIREEIPKELTYPNCKIGCYCRGAEDINCAVLDCPEWLGVRPKSGHHFTYKHNECCSSGQKAAPFATCKVGDEEYKEGQRFDSPNKRCTNCVCQKGFDGKFVEPFCVEQTCVEEMNKMTKIKANCAPSYFGDNGCCPFRWICPDDEKADDKIVPATDSEKSAQGQAQCKYGAKLLNIGDKFERIEHISEYDRFEIKCECTIPPLVTCQQKQVFDLEKTPQHIKDAFKL